jgi:hypothetical protein
MKMFRVSVSVPASKNTGRRQMLLVSVQDRVRGEGVGWCTALQAARSRVRFPVGSIGIFH